MQNRDIPKSLFDHLGDLRGSLVRSAIVLVVFFIIAWIKSDQLTSLFLNSVLETVKTFNGEFIALDILDRFWILVKVSALTAVIGALPFILWEIYRFLKPALKPQELMICRVAFSVGPILFISGVAFWLFLILPKTVEALLSLGPAEVKNMLGLNQFLGFSLFMGLIFGMIFELPIILLALIRVGVLQTSFLVENRRVAIIFMAIFAAVITPSPDAFSMFALLVPMVIFYEITVIVGRLVEKRDVSSRSSMDSATSA